jgi:hypothetical protein
MARHTLTHADRLFAGNGQNNGYENSNRGIEISPLFLVDYGAPIAASANNICLSQGLNTGVNALINGAIAAAGVATNATPRALVAAWTTAAVLTIRGFDQYGFPMTETSASGTAHTGKKAFKTVTQITTSVNITALTVGTGDVLGLPFRVGANGVITARANNAVDVAVQVVADTTSPATGLTGDVRGTVDPAIALNGANTFAVLVKPASLLDNEGSFGVAQFAG